MPTRAVLLVAIALACFAGNSLLCRLALAGRAIDAATFTSVRIASGALVLAFLARGRGERPKRAGGRSRSYMPGLGMSSTISMELSSPIMK